MNIPAVLVAPVSAGQPLAELAVKLGDETLLTAPLRALEDNPEGSLWQRSRMASASGSNSDGRRVRH